MLSADSTPQRAAALPAASGLAADPAGVANLRQAARAGGGAGLEAAARAFEALLVGQMLKQMRAASSGGGLFDSAHGKLYLDLHDQEVARMVSDGQGLGIRQALLRQLASTGAGASAPLAPEHLRVPERNPWLRRRVPEHVAPPALTDDQKVGAARRAAGQPLTAPPPIAPGDWPPADAETFMRLLEPHARAAAGALGFDHRVLLAQCALETGWGRRVPRRADGVSSYNLFGIKADRRWQGAEARVGTLEFRNGVARRELASFRAYSSPAESFLDYVEFLRANPRYRNALASGDSRAFVRGLQQAGYATDPGYAGKILGIYDRLRRMDTQAAAQDGGRPADTTANTRRV